MSETESQKSTRELLEALKRARAKRADITVPSVLVQTDSEDTVTLTKAQLQDILNTTVEQTLQKVQRVETTKQRLLEIPKTGDPEVDAYLEDLKQSEERIEEIRKSVAARWNSPKLARITRWAENPEYQVVMPGKHVVAPKDATPEQLASLAGTVQAAGTRESMTGLSGGGVGNEARAKREAEKQ